MREDEAAAAWRRCGFRNLRKTIGLVFTQETNRLPPRRENMKLLPFRDDAASVI